MWGLTNETGFRVARCFARSREGAEWWLVAIKGTFAMVDGRLRLADEQEPIHLGPLFTGDPARTSLRYESDLVLGRPVTDVVLHGTAHAPGHQPVRELDVTLAVGRLRKTLRVVGDRTLKRGLAQPSLSAPEPFVTMPLGWERAFGGIDEDGAAHPSNPVGTGFSRDTLGSRALMPPNVESPGEPYEPTGRRCRPAGFGPIARHWSPRRELAGTYDDVWAKTRRPLPPDDYSERFLQCAPEDQQVVGDLTGGEDAVLLNLTPSGVWRFRLPRPPLGCTTSFASRRTHQHPRLRTVVIEPDLGRVLMTWIVAVPCGYRLYWLDGSRVFFKRHIGRSLGDENSADWQEARS